MIINIPAIAVIVTALGMEANKSNLTLHDVKSAFGEKAEQFFFKNGVAKQHLICQAVFPKLTPSKVSKISRVQDIKNAFVIGCLLYAVGAGFKDVIKMSDNKKELQEFLKIKEALDVQ